VRLCGVCRDGAYLRVYYIARFYNLEFYKQESRKYVNEFLLKSVNDFVFGL
jgi:hypothetical protein